QGSSDLEWICDLLGMRLLVPTQKLIAELRNYPSPDSERFSLSAFKRLERTFGSPWRIVVERLNEQGLWAGIVLHLHAYRRPPARPPYKHKTNFEWYPEWYSAPRDLLEEIGIAFAFRTTTGSRRFRRIWRDLNELLSGWISSEKPPPEIKQAVP